MKYIDGKAYKKVEPHLHLSPVSVCAHIDAESALARLKECGFDAVVLTNHYSRAYIDVRGATEAQWREAYLESYHNLKRAAEGYGIEVFLGTEVTLQAVYIPFYRTRWSEEFLQENYADYLVYGITEEFLRETPFLCDLTLPELREICSAYGAVIIQAHPFRTEQGHSLKDFRYFDGIEINGNEGFPSGPHEAEVLSIAREHGLIVTCGGDTHAASDAFKSATYVPEDVHDSVSFASYLKRVKIPPYSLK